MPEHQNGSQCHCELADGGSETPAPIGGDQICRWEAPSSGGLAGNGAPAPAGWCGLGTCQEGARIAVTTSDEPQPVGRGGDIRPGKYVLSELTQHEVRDCYTLAGETFAQTLLLRADEGGIVGDDNRALHWGSRFTHATEGSTIAIAMTCDSGAQGPFGPFETYTATQDSLELYSSECGFRAQYRLISAAVP